MCVPSARGVGGGGDDLSLYQFSKRPVIERGFKTLP